MKKKLQEMYKGHMKYWREKFLDSFGGFFFCVAVERWGDALNVDVEGHDHVWNQTRVSLKVHDVTVFHKRLM